MHQVSDLFQELHNTIIFVCLEISFLPKFQRQILDTAPNYIKFSNDMSVRPANMLRYEVKSHISEGSNEPKIRIQIRDGM